MSKTQAKQIPTFVIDRDNFVLMDAKKKSPESMGGSRVLKRGVQMVQSIITYFSQLKEKTRSSANLLGA